MATIFSFKLDETFLENYAAYMKQLRVAEPGKSYYVTISVELIPDGAGYEIAGGPQISVEEEDTPPDIEASIPSSPSGNGWLITPQEDK